MGKNVHIHLMIDRELEEELTNRARRHGDRSKIVNKALQAYFSALKIKESAQDA